MLYCYGLAIKGTLLRGIGARLPDILCFLTTLCIVQSESLTKSYLNLFLIFRSFGALFRYPLFEDVARIIVFSKACKASGLLMYGLLLMFPWAFL